MNEIQRQPITQDLFCNFIEWIDRGEGTTRTYLANLRQFFYYLQDRTITQPTRADVLDYRDSLQRRGLKATTVSAYLRSVRQFFAWTSAAGIYPNIAQNVHGPKVDHTTHRRDALTPAEVLQVEEEIEQRRVRKIDEAEAAAKDRTGRVQRAEEQGLRDLAIYFLAVNEGLRVVEISRADIQDLETRCGQTWLFIWRKGHSEPDTRKALSPETAAAVTDYLQARGATTGPLFVSTGNRGGGGRLPAKTIGALLKQRLEEAGLTSSRITAHSLRHSAATDVLTMTGDLTATQHFLGHQDPRTTLIYAHIDREAEEAEIANKIWDYRRAAASV